jgi:hypothetical protein
MKPGMTAVVVVAACAHVLGAAHAMDRPVSATELVLRRSATG